MPTLCAKCDKPATQNKWYGGSGIGGPIRLCQEHAEQFMCEAREKARARRAKFR